MAPLLDGQFAKTGIGQGGHLDDWTINDPLELHARYVSGCPAAPLESLSLAAAERYVSGQGAVLAASHPTLPLHTAYSSRCTAS